MKRYGYKQASEGGVSLVETLVVVVIIAIVAAFALMQFGEPNQMMKRQNVARELKVALERGRFDSVKRRADTSSKQARVTVTSAAFILTTDNDLSGSIESSDDVVTAFGSQNISISPTGSMTLPFTVLFNQRGEPVNSSGVSVSPVFLVCNGVCVSPNVSNSNIVVLTPTGTVNLLAGGSEVPVFPTPNVTNVPPGAGISNMVSVP
ncbi:MAG: prepilin-type N-terminal cleavage/methylation domain-containing protein [Pyrinomonadaceae bacterium]|nr:prepilin-type N-terminal cleavage/methylation domain-containing protein [Acidobacteriota bacterium]MBP7377121.1 prepilin-type N-terminal cleavage/methylation domain-containing protein [Pyrinomonadaceae bacterium]